MDLFGSVWTCLDLFGLVWTCLDMFGLVWTCLNFSQPLLDTMQSPLWPSPLIMIIFLNICTLPKMILQKYNWFHNFDEILFFSKSIKSGWRSRTRSARPPAEDQRPRGRGRSLDRRWNFGIGNGSDSGNGFETSKAFDRLSEVGPSNEVEAG